MNEKPAPLIMALNADWADFLHDESRRTGQAEQIAFPENETDVITILRECARRGEPVTVQGARTGITGGAVPSRGLILNLSRMKRMGEPRRDGATGQMSICVQPGVLLRELREWLAQHPCPAGDVTREYFFPPDPTETTASLGGMIACNASGALSFHYGGTRGWVRALRVVLSNGETLSLRRGRDKAHGRDFELRTENGAVIRGRLPTYQMPHVKNAAGYFAKTDMDMVDLFIGSEGTLGVVTEAELMLLAAPRVVWGVMFFLRDANAVADLVNELRITTHRPVAIEYFDRGALLLLAANRGRMAALQSLPPLHTEWNAALYVEVHAEDEEHATEAIVEAAAIFERAEISDEASWSATDDVQMRKLKEFRHAVPEAVNTRIDELRRREPRLTKLGTDMAVPDEKLRDVLNMYSTGLRTADLEAVQFGHIGNNHIHVNIMPRSWDEYERGRELYHLWAQQVVEWGGTVSAEHGIGKAKKELLRLMYGQSGVEDMSRLKRIFDPRGILGAGTLFD